MPQDKRRYFIEVPLNGGEAVSRRYEAEARRAMAAQFVGEFSQWLRDQDLDSKVASIAVTALGQVLITCEMDIISRMRKDENLHIANIRSAAALAGSIQRITNW
ncbi:MAG: hypothetical protein PHW76_10305 [Alphaproteobacteria bacterium]|nr:hypothetical protein [Alphaproteobacteria bacterium]